MTRDQRHEAYLTAIRRRVRATCLDGRGDGTCGLTGRFCALEAHLPAVVEAVLAIDSPRMEPPCQNGGSCCADEQCAANARRG